MDKETALFTVIGELHFKLRLLEDQLEDAKAEINRLNDKLGIETTQIIRPQVEERAEDD
jgi:hypothetical protein